MSIDRALAARLPALHEQQERQETANVLASDQAAAMGVTSRDWGDGLWSVRCGRAPHHEPGNQITGVTVDALDRLVAILPWFDEAGCACHVRLPGPVLEAKLGARMAGLGFVAHELEAWMAAPVATVEAAARSMRRADGPRPDIRPVTSARDVEAFLAALWVGWSIEGEARRAIAGAAMGPFPGPPWWRRYVAFVDGRPAAEAVMALFEEGVAYLADAATVPAFRKRGLQRALIARRAEDARAAGAEHLFGAVQYGDASWANMRALGLTEAYMTLRFRRPPAEARTA